MKRLALILAIMGFFLMACVGWACGQEPLVCAIRSAVGAVALYVIMRLAGGLAVRILVDAVMRNPSQPRGRKDS
jgi:hypothetical protein